MKSLFKQADQQTIERGRTTTLGFIHIQFIFNDWQSLYLLLCFLYPSLLTSSNITSTASSRIFVYISFSLVICYIRFLFRIIFKCFVFLYILEFLFAHSINSFYPLNYFSYSQSKASILFYFSSNSPCFVSTYRTYTSYIVLTFVLSFYMYALSGRSTRVSTPLPDASLVT